MKKAYICLDIGGTKVLGAVFDENLKIICKVKKKTKAEEGQEKIEERIISIVEELIAQSGISKENLAAIGAGAPGIINEDTGEIIYTPNIPWRNYNIRKVIENKFKVPFFIGNDVKMGVLGEWKYGAGKNMEDIVGIFVGTGIGGGVIINNKLYSGARHSGTEIGHMIINTEGPYCNCGQRGCLEAYASKIAITKDIKSQMNRGRKTILKDLMEENTLVIKSKTLKKAIDEKDELAIEVVDKAIYYLAAGAGSLINIFNPNMMIMGGGVFEALGDYMLPLLKEQIKKFSMPVVLEGTEIVQSKLNDDSILFGSLALINGKMN
ncbi:MAG: ROK family protein [Bacillota bacterium]|nr:ROK family protein [Bacillota bacterium]